MATHRWKDVQYHQAGKNANQNHSEGPPHTCQKGIINKGTNSKCWQGCGEKGAPVHCGWDCKSVQPLWETARSFLKELKIE